MLDPEGERLPGLWADGSVPVADVRAYFGGAKSIAVSMFDQVIVPKCDPALVRSAVTKAVESGLVWLVNSPTSLWKEACPMSALDGAAELRPSPDPISQPDLLPEALPAAWNENATNGFTLAQAVSQAHGEAMLWGLVRESIRSAVDTGWLEIAEGQVDCRYSDAGQLHLKRPAAKSEPVQDPSPGPVPGNGGGALLNMLEVQNLGDLTSDLLDLTAGHDFPFRVRAVPGATLDPELRRRVNERLAEISTDLRVDSP